MQLVVSGSEKRCGIVGQISRFDFFFFIFDSRIATPPNRISASSKIRRRCHRSIVLQFFSRSPFLFRFFPLISPSHVMILSPSSFRGPNSSFVHPGFVACLIQTLLFLPTSLIAPVFVLLISTLCFLPPFPPLCILSFLPYYSLFLSYTLSYLLFFPSFTHIHYHLFFFLVLSRPIEPVPPSPHPLACFEMIN